MASILIVDDSRTSRKVLKNLLEADGHIIAGEAVNGQEGVARYRELKPDLVTMDITMPVLDGLKALELIKAYNQDAKVVMITAAGQQSKMVDAIRLGASDFLTKPFVPDQISFVINQVLE